ncbi:hypothetical protein ACNFB1_12235 [Pseudomonas sp. NY15349]|uniref:hypothetical protein n=1 Tax=unclassified Pseudomonas TaxID=196821 RepID=UPI0012E90EF4|nr:hypothetical protein [Pseudomonas sp. p21]
MADVSLLCGTFVGKLASQDGALDRRYERWVSLATLAQQGLHVFNCTLSAFIFMS